MKFQHNTPYNIQWLNPKGKCLSIQRGKKKYIKKKKMWSRYYSMLHRVVTSCKCLLHPHTLQKIHKMWKTKVLVLAYHENIMTSFEKIQISNSVRTEYKYEIFLTDLKLTLIGQLVSFLFLFFLRNISLMK